MVKIKWDLWGGLLTGVKILVVTILAGILVVPTLYVIGFIVLSLTGGTAGPTLMMAFYGVGAFASIILSGIFARAIWRWS